MIEDAYIDQLSIFLENKEGRILSTLDVIENLGINIRALSLADTSEFGILRLIVTDPYKVKETLEEKGFIVKITKVFAVSITDEPGGLNTILRLLDENNINLEYLYAFVEQKTYAAIVILKLEDMPKAYDILVEGNANIINSDELYSL
ncbi:MAG: acetolactate synthase [Methanosphaera sp.]|uniref:acetolactate synthase n=1 Tax=Methanosphaera sp. TaxID=2666342 RepID=UPI0025F00193|nr:acetolactate synthase [Methanosphaera sp.]MCI5867137.1 acetolactate synthase [Methanosphaera sp.]MDD6534794.1 acetolactate synthase [Methanosphaera sp.]MDY3955538.1 acetolactate synthase [Methanosphaera sp.]